jgi:predicted nucleic acid-binding protein
VIVVVAEREVLRASLGPGESEAISLALEIRADRLIVDE